MIGVIKAQRKELGQTQKLFNSKYKRWIDATDGGNNAGRTHQGDGGTVALSLVVASRWKCHRQERRRLYVVAHDPIVVVLVLGLALRHWGNC